MKLIAEPWDCGPGGYQVGGFPPGWAEWNDKFRDTVRDFWKGDGAGRGARAAAVPPPATSSTTAAAGPGRASTSSPRTTASRCNDLVSYNDKHNEANGEDNRDGTRDNRSWNCGVEGPTDDPEIIALRERQKRNLLATLLLSQGTPMLLAGDEFGRTQQRQQQRLLPGQRDQLARLEHRRGRGQGADRASSQKLISAAPQVSDPAPHPLLFTGEYNEELGVKDLTWINANGAEMQAEEWDDGNMRCFGMLIGRPRPGDRHPQARPGRDAAADLQRLSRRGGVHPAEAPGGEGWILLVDTNLADQDEHQHFAIGATYQVTGRSFLVFLLKATRAVG